MIWYFLYPFRGTTEPPKLPQNHPLRKVFLHHGAATSKHWFLSILVSVLTASLLCYPVVFLYDRNITRYTLPHHVWASARWFDEDTPVRADVEVRQLWVHGSYMRAIEHNVIKDALELQDFLLASAFAEQAERDSSKKKVDILPPGVPPRTYETACREHTTHDVSWGFHSPLMYWNCSRESLDTDHDLLETINRQVERRSFLRFTLRPTSVFAGKAFIDNKLKAADALVITMVSRLGSGAGPHWEKRSIDLASHAEDRGWAFYPETGRPAKNQLYQFRVQPVSWKDDFFLAAAYTAMLVYIIFSLRKLRAVKSRFGLGVTIIAQICISIMASFTICGLLRINLARIPQEAYPFVVVVVGMENMFRLTNAVLSTPLEMPTLHRVSNALADVGHLSLAATGQNLFLLWLLSRVVSPGVSAFCAFAAVALVFDFVFHLTFFVAVLSVDVRRLELQDSLDRSKLFLKRTRSQQKVEPQSFAGSFLGGNTSSTTRIAGSVMLICFVLILNWHFFEGDSSGRALSDIFGMRRDRGKSNFDPRRPPPINMARTPSAWFKLQEKDNVQEVMGFLRPMKPTFTARIYEPLVVVLKGADRKGVPSHTMSLLARFREAVDSHVFPFTMALGFIVALLTLFLNYLLWNGFQNIKLEHKEEEDEHEVGSLLAIKNLPVSHTLDIIQLSAGRRGNIISVSLDRSMSICHYDPNVNAYSISMLRTAMSAMSLWPVSSTATDRSGKYLAISCRSGKIALWSFHDRQVTSVTDVDLNGQDPTLLSFARGSLDSASEDLLLVVTQDGQLTSLDVPQLQNVTQHQLDQGHVLCASLIRHGKNQPRLLTVHRNGDVLLTDRLQGAWRTVTLQQLSPRLSVDGKLCKAKQAFVAQGIPALAVSRNGQLDLLNSDTLNIIHSFSVGEMKSRSLRVLHSTPRSCPNCGSAAVHSLSLVYTDLKRQTFVMQTHTTDDTADSLVCLHEQAYTDRGCSGLLQSQTDLHEVDYPGVWEMTASQAVIGFRKKSAAKQISDTDGIQVDNFSPLQSVTSAIRNRKMPSASNLANALIPGKSRSTNCSPLSSLNRLHRPDQGLNGHSHRGGAETDVWEAWAMSPSGELHTTPLLASRAQADSSGDSIMSSSNQSGVTIDSATDSIAATILPQQDDDELFVAAPGPIASLGYCSVAVTLGNAVKIVTFGKESFGKSDEPGDWMSNGVWRRKQSHKKASHGVLMDTSIPI